ncbi:MAG TPA: isoprenylcysteine carboxylmethyltransferase family protein [Methyloceanibacter sp.]|jgi:protein-S-isoprenylcysteine O-methyltransferase Ste14|nr:isoprenylcysteine carboxylmethyltransferase family protein [Methyloceanibacter sp.]
MDARPEIVEGRPRRWGIRSVAWVVVFAFLLFVPAGTVRWPSAWVYLAILAVASVWGFAWLERHDPELLKERLRPPIQRGQPLADKLLMGTFIPVWFGWFVLMGLDRRFGWSNVPVSLEILGAVLVCLGIWLSWQVLKENSYAAPVVKVQKERGHKVVSSGPYAYVRHPMYSSVILFAAGVPLLLGSWWGLIVSPLLIVVLAVRAVVEERTLKAELEGYADYAERVRYRFVPLLW